MPDIKVDVNDLKFIERPHNVLYIGGGLTIFIANGQINVERDGNVVSQVRGPSIFSQCFFVDLEDAVILMFDGRQIIVLYKQGEAPQQHTVDHRLMGSAITPHYYFGGDSIVFGTSNFNRVQLVRYDFVLGTREAQTQSYDLQTIDDLKCADGRTYAVLNDCLLLCFDMQTGRELWRKFDVTGVNGELCLTQQSIVYASKSLLKRVGPDRVLDHIMLNVPIVSVLHALNDHLFICLTGSGKSISLVDTDSRQIKWTSELAVDIKKSVVIYDKGNPVLMTCATHYVHFIDLQAGRLLKMLKLPGVTSITTSPTAVVAHKSDGSSLMFEGD